jgi:hypothetical protein
MNGHDRLVVDVRPLIARLLADDGRATPTCAHPYDLAALLVAEEAGVIVTDPWGAAVNAPLVLNHDVPWVGYANSALRDRIEPVLQEVLARRGWLDPLVR